MVFQTITWIVAALSILGQIMVTKKNRNGFLVWIFANLVWMAIDVHMKIWAQAVLMFIFFCISVWSYNSWKDVKEAVKKDG